MRKFFLVFICGIVVSISSSAQNISWGTEQPNTSEREIHSIIGFDDNGYYVTRYENPHPHVINATYAFLVTLEKYDYSGNQIFSKDFNVEEDGAKFNFCNIYYMKNNMVTLMYGPDVKTLYAMKVGPDGTIDNKDKVIIGKVDNKWKKEIMPETNYIFSLSNDKSTLVGYYRKEKEKNINLVAVDDSPKLLWSKDITLPFEGDFNIGSIEAVGNTVYFLIYEKKAKDDYSRCLLTYDNGTGKFQKTDLGASIGENMNLKVSESKIDPYTNDFVQTGLYTTDQSKNDVMGMFVIRVNHTTGQVTKNTFAFDNNFLSTIISQKMIDKGRGIPSLDINDFTILNDKSIIITMEQNLAYGGQQGGPVGGMRQANAPIGAPGSISPGVSASYDYNDAIIAKISANGTLDWINKIAKRQEGYTRALSAYVCSYKTFLSGNTFYVLFTENKKNLSLPAEMVATNEDKLSTTPQIEGYPERASQVLTSINISSGEVKQNIINAEEDKKNAFYTLLAIQAKQNSLIVYKGYKKGGVFGQIPLN